MSIPRVAFVCVHNACRSQIAQALGTLLAADVFESHSAGTQETPHINPDAVRLMQRHYSIDMEQAQHPKLLTALPPVDIVVTMGCNVQCPTLPCRHREDWGLADPSSQPDEVFLQTIAAIHKKILDLAARLRSGAITLR